MNVFEKKSLDGLFMVDLAIAGSDPVKLKEAVDYRSSFTTHIDGINQREARGELSAADAQNLREIALMHY